MPRLNFSLDDLADIVRALRVLARQARADAEKQGRSSTRRIFEESATRHERLADEVEAAWRAEQSR